MSLKDLHFVLGDPSILETVAGAARSTVILEGGVVVGLACFEPLYGPYAEMALAVRDREHAPLVHDLIAQLKPQVRRHHAHTIRACVLPEQEQLAAGVPGAQVRDGYLELRLDAVPVCAPACAPPAGSGRGLGPRGDDHGVAGPRQVLPA